jgi:hypothetical protein
MDEKPFPFSTESAAINWLTPIIMGVPPVCRACGAVGKTTQTIRLRTHLCSECRTECSILRDTPVMHLKLRLNEWLHMMWLLETDFDKPIQHIAFEVGLPYQTAARRAKQLKALWEDPFVVGIRKHLAVVRDSVTVSYIDTRDFEPITFRRRKTRPATVQ